MHIMVGTNLISLFGGQHIGMHVSLITNTHSAYLCIDPALSTVHYYTDVNLFHTNTHLNCLGSMQHMQPKNLVHICNAIAYVTDIGIWINTTHP